MDKAKEKLQVIIKENELFGKVRFAIINGKEYAVGKDVAVALGYKNPRDAIRTKCKGVVKHDSLKEGGYSISLILEPDIYRLIFGSKLDSAEKFQDWVFNEVLPQIRQTGGYIPINKEMSDDEIMAKALIVAQNTLKRKEELLKQKDIQLKEQEPLVELAKKRLDKNGLVSITDVTKTFNLKRGEVTKWAKDNGYLHKTRTEVNDKGSNYFRVYYANNYRCVGVTENGLTLIHENFSKERE